MYELDGQVAVVTGAGGEHGIGRAIASRLAREGANVAVTDLVERPHNENRTEWNGLASVVDEIQQSGRLGVAIQCDVTDAESVRQMVDRTVESLGRIDILVNNAGALAGQDRLPVVDLKESEWDRVHSVNVKGTFLCAQAAARQMIAQGNGGRIINMSSTAGKAGVPRFAAYCASKFAVIGFTQSMAQELGEHRITVNAICPGLTETERLNHMASVLRPEDIGTADYRQQYVQSIADGVPLGRIARPTDVANMAAFLASAEAGYLTGMAMTVDGGATMR